MMLIAKRIYNLFIHIFQEYYKTLNVASNFVPKSRCQIQFYYHFFYDFSMPPTKIYANCFSSSL